MPCQLLASCSILFGKTEKQLAAMAHVKFQICMLLSLASFFWTFSETYSTVANSSTLYFGLMLSLSGDDESSGALAGVQAALDEINSRDNFLPGYSLNFTPIIDKKVTHYIEKSKFK